MKKILAALSMSLAVIAPCTHAQVTAPAPAAAAAIDPAALAAARELLVSMNYRDVVGKMFEQMRKSMPAMMQQGATAAINADNKLDAAQKTAALAKMNKELGPAVEAIGGIFSDPTLFDEMMQDTAALYARHFTVTELRQIAAFYKSPVGAKMLTSMPQLMNESMQSGQRIVMPRIARIMQKLQSSQ